MKKTLSHKLRRHSSTLFLLSAGLILIASALLPVVLPRGAGASQLTSRFLQLSSGIPGGTSVNYTYGFTYVSSASAIQSIKFVACTTAIATYGLAGTSSTSGCTAPSGMAINAGTQQGTLGGSWTNTTAFTRDTSTIGNCAPAANVLCITRTQAAAESAAAKTVTWNTQTNPTTANSSFFVGIYLYSATGYTTSTDTGTVASAVVQTLTVNAAVAEILNFCIGSTLRDAATGGTQNGGSSASDCTQISGTSVNLGTLDTSKISITPETTNCTPADCTKNGVAMLRTNASNGATVSFDSVQQSGTRHKGTLRISGATCSTDSEDNNTDNTDQCFNTRTAQATFSTGTERFGMTVAYVNCDSTTSYTCTYSSDTYNLKRDAAYDCTGANTTGLTDVDQITGPTQCGYAWDEDGTMTQIATSASSTTKQVDDEALILKFAAAPVLTTPFGSYTAQSDFVAVATY